MTQEELNRKISEIREDKEIGPSYYLNPEGTEVATLAKNWHSPANAMTLLSEMTDKVSVEIEPFNGSVIIDVAFPSIVNIKGSLESAICQAYIKWKAAK